ncbi:MAG: hypothetical protein LBB13_00765 [Rickettsiales bacterium]|nr:hypothetical protein [Rickettsiales bacterium]
MKNHKLFLFSTFVLIVVGGQYFWYYVHKNRLLNKMIGQMIILGFHGTSPRDAEVQALAQDIRAGRVGGVILFNIDVRKAKSSGNQEWRRQTKSHNIIDVEQVAQLNEFLQNAAHDGGNPPLFVAVDQEGGTVIRLGPEHGFPVVLPAAKEMSNMPLSKIEELYFETGVALHRLGFNVDFAPVVDIDVNPKSPAIGALGRAFSADPSEVIDYGRVASNGLARAGMIYTFKHFPGHGSAEHNTHYGIADITNLWSTIELQPYRELVTSTMSGMVMVAHLICGQIDPTMPASLSPKWIDGILRRDIGFDGVVISDDLQMDAIYGRYGLRETLRLSINAGNDILLIGNNLKRMKNPVSLLHREIITMVRHGEISQERLKKSYERILKLKEKIR